MNYKCQIGKPQGIYNVIKWEKQIYLKVLDLMHHQIKIEINQILFCLDINIKLCSIYFVKLKIF